ncbi:MAG: hypothetical protein LUF92_08505 [Clostridiales bacterium]|nr:hypothetical protein [Clostridiales bacterium]
MTNLEFENMAMSTVQNISGPEVSFAELKKKKETRKRKVFYTFSGFKSRRFVIAMIAVLVFTVSGLSLYAGQISYGMWAFYESSSTYISKYDIRLPQEMGDATMSDETQWLKIVPHGDSWMEALFNPLYTVASVTYYENAESYCDIDIGSTKNEYWKTYFSYDEEEKWNPVDKKEGENSRHYGEIQTIEYEKVKLYWARLTMEGEAYENGAVSDIVVTWVDEGREICISLCVSNTTNSETAIDLAREIINLNQ